MSRRAPQGMPSSHPRPAPQPTAFPAPPPGVDGALAGAAERCLRSLPADVLRAMETGLIVSADELAPGALFRGRDSGGCAVGVTLRQLAPDAFRFGRVEFWLWHRWRRGVELDVARRFPQLQQLQRVFDDAVRAVEEAGSGEEPAKAVGLWLGAGAQAELQARQLATRQSGLPANRSARWHRRRAHPPLGGQPGAASSEHHLAEMETSSCS